MLYTSLYVHTIKSLAILASWCMHHGNCIVSHAPFHLCMEHPIVALHHHCNHTFHGCIINMVIEQLHSELEHFVIIPWLHRHKWACFATSIVQINQIINSEQGCSRRSFSTNLSCYPHLFSQALCWISPISVFFVLSSQLDENMITSSHHHILDLLTFSLLDQEALRDFTNRSSWRVVYESSLVFS